MKLSFSALSYPARSTKAFGGDACIVLVGDKNNFGPAASDMDKKLDGLLKRALESSRFTGKAKEILSVPTPKGFNVGRIFLLGTGDAKSLDAAAAEALGGALVPALNAAGVKSASLILDSAKTPKLSVAAIAAHMAHGAQLKSYRFDKYRTTEKADKKPSLKSLAVLVAETAAARTAFAALDAVASGVFLSRDLSSEPANILYPASFADRVKKELVALGLKVEILDEPAMRKLGMWSLLGVGQGSVRDSRMVIVQHMGNPKAKTKPPIAFVGKGITFDTGGISIKPSGGMEEMKWDMSGAGVVAGLFKTLAKRKAKVNAIGIMALAENMPDGNAQRPGDVVKSMSGQTIEVLNTDAEGRLVLADALWYCQERFKPELIVDLATLTGAVIMALSHEYAGVMGNNDKLISQLKDAGETVDEKLWQLPLCETFDRAIDSKIADMGNISTIKGAGSSTAGQFLQRFIKPGLPWAHLDIAGTAWTDKDRAVVPAGATGFGVRLLNALVAKHYEA